MPVGTWELSLRGLSDTGQTMIEQMKETKQWDVRNRHHEWVWTCFSLVEIMTGLTVQWCADWESFRTS